jgi:hypothetical protein
MAHITDKDYQKLANAVADDLVSQKRPLNDSICKLAADMGMNDEQIARLCEATNNVTFNKLFQAKGQDKTASDRLIDFDVADTKKILGSMIKKAENSGDFEKAASYWEMRDLDDVDMHAIRAPEADAPLEKTAFVLRPETQPSLEKDLRTLQKAADHTRHQKLAADMAYQDQLLTLSKRFSQLYDVMPFTQFEKSAAVLFGKTAEPHLNAIRKLRRMPEVTYDVGALTKTAGYVEDTFPELKQFAALMAAANDVTALTRSASRITDGIKRLGRTH